MIDYGTRQTDLALKRMEARLRAVYRQAERDIAAKTEDYWKRHAARDAKYRQQVADGKLSKEDYEAWQRGQVFQGDVWTARKGAIQDVLYNADTAALQMINDGKVDAFAANANYMGYALEHGENVNFGFSLYDGPTVTRLLKDNPQILPKARVKKEKAYVWYNKLVNNCVLQGIIQGESIGEIAERIGKTTGERTRSAMLRNARTAYTGAQNAGRLEGMRQAEKLGVNVKKRWMATLDARTRDSHADLDGQVQDRDKPFKSPLGDIMFPGDPTAKPGNVYNCRCTITYVYPEYASTMTRRDNENGEIVGDMTYREWEEMKRGSHEEHDTGKRPGVINGRDISGTWERREDEFDFAINDVINAQGFDGKPRILDEDEFDKAVQDSNFVAMRGYHGPDQETLEAYRDALYHGDWYVDCSNGGAMFGQGMYAAANFHGDASGQVKSVGDSYSGGTGFVETFTMVKDTNFVQYDDINAEFNGAIIPQSILTKAIDDLNDDELTLFKYNLGDKSVTWKDVSMAFERAGSEGNKKVSDRLMDAWAQTRNEADANRTKYGNVGVYAAAKGYDAIVCDDRDKDGVYVVVLNRTKVIFRRP